MFQRIAMFRGYSLSAYLSVLFAFIAITPLLVTIISIFIFLQPALISQVSGDMERDAQTRIQAIDTYMAERLNDVKTLSQSTAIKNYLAGDPDPNNTKQMDNILFTALHRDIANYISFSLLDTKGSLKYHYPALPLSHGNAYITPEILQQIPQSGKVLISDVFFDAVANNASIDLYARVIDNNFQLTGIIRVSLGLHRIWEPVDNEPQVNGADSYAFVLDQHGVRIAYTNPDHSGFKHPSYLFKAVAPLPADFEQRIKDENLYGNSSTAVTTVADANLASAQKNIISTPVTQFDPAEKNQRYELAGYTSTVVPWTYFILKPLNTVTGIAVQQLLTILIIAAVMLFLVILIGIQTGRRIALPIMRSVTSLRKNSLSLKTLSDEERVVATEQLWMVEASQVALRSIKYYTNASNIAAQRLKTISQELAQRSPNITLNTLNSALKEVLETAAYIEEAIKRQDNFNEKLSTALHVTTQASEQITKGATSTDTAATQLEEIVRQLTAVVGERDARMQEQNTPPQNKGR